MKTIFHAASSRGHADHGWLNAHHSFSFANWYDPSRINFGMLRVLNDDIVAGGQGFGTHPHNDMEIITIILDGALEHKDSMGNGSVIKPGDIQVMSAGTGVMHSEFNPLKDKATNLFQLWIFPKENGIKPRYDQKTFDVADRKNKIQTVASGFKTGDELYIHQNAAISLANLEKDSILNYELKDKNNGAYIMVINGNLDVEGTQLGKKDAIGVWETEKITLKAGESTEIIIIEVPMN